jgi:hypothetical protein
MAEIWLLILLCLLPCFPQDGIVQLITRLISSETGLSSEKLRTEKLEKHEGNTKVI